MLVPIQTYQSHEIQQQDITNTIFTNHKFEEECKNCSARWVSYRQKQLSLNSLHLRDQP